MRGRYLHINELVTTRSVRSKGVGQHLLNKLFEEKRQIPIPRPHARRRGALPIPRTPVRLPRRSADHCVSLRRLLWFGPQRIRWMPIPRRGRIQLTAVTNATRLSIFTSG